MTLAKAKAAEEATTSAPLSKLNGVNDLAEYDAFVSRQEAGRECTISNPKTGEPLSLKITVVGRGSRRFKRASRWLSERQAERAIGGSAMDGDADDDMISFLARLCVNWSGCMVDGKEIAFSVNEAEKLFQRFPFIVDQIDSFAGRAVNFTQA
jgi:hypothetical protein